MKLFLIFIFAPLFLLTTSCSQLGTDASAGGQDSSTHNLNSQYPSINRIMENESAYLGKSVQLTAIFMGWNGKCRSAPPVTRSDWMIEDGTGCIYVNGKLPAGQKAQTPNKVKVSIKGVVKKNQFGIIYIELN